jgi:hypothetical protein
LIVTLQKDKHQFEIDKCTHVISTTDTQEITFTAMLKSFQAAFPDAKPQITTHPNLTAEWEKAVMSVYQFKNKEDIPPNFIKATPPIAEPAVKIDSEAHQRFIP